MKLKLIFMICLIANICYGQDFEELKGILATGMVKSDSYLIAVYKGEQNKMSSQSLLNRVISLERFKEGDVIKVQETTFDSGMWKKVVCRVEKNSLKPLQMEIYQNDVKMEEYIFEGGLVKHKKYMDGLVEENEESFNNDMVFFSSNFSEIIQSNNFNKHPRIKYSVYSPQSKSIGVFSAEMLKEHKFEVSGKIFNTWVIKFRREQKDGTWADAGYRFVEINTQKVLAFTENLDSRDGFSYQTLMLNF